LTAGEGSIILYSALDGTGRGAKDRYPTRRTEIVMEIEASRTGISQPVR
jgi:hypothetical protein